MSWREKKYAAVLVFCFSYILITCCLSFKCNFYQLFRKNKLQIKLKVEINSNNNQNFMFMLLKMPTSLPLQILYLPAAFWSLLWWTKFLSWSLHMAYRACKGLWATNSWGPGADCFFNWELESGRGRAADWVPVGLKDAPSFLLSYNDIKSIQTKVFNLVQHRSLVSFPYWFTLVPWQFHPGYQRSASSRWHQKTFIIRHRRPSCPGKKGVSGQTADTVGLRI